MQQSELLPEVQQVLIEAKAKLDQLVGYPVKVNYTIDIKEDSLNKLQQIICEAAEISTIQLMSRHRYNEYKIPRQIFCWFATVGLGFTTTHIGKLLNRDHSTIVHARNKVKMMIQTQDEAYIHIINAVQQKIKE